MEGNEDQDANIEQLVLYQAEQYRGVRLLVMCDCRDSAETQPNISLLAKVASTDRTTSGSGPCSGSCTVGCEVEIDEEHEASD